MKYRVQDDLSFNTEEYYLEHVAYVKKLFADGKLAMPSLKEILDRPDLYTYNRLTSRMTIIKDYDDEGNNQGGEQIEVVELVNPIEA